MASFLSRLQNTQKKAMVIGGGLLLLVGLAYAIAEYRLLGLGDVLEAQIAEQQKIMLGVLNGTNNNSLGATSEPLVRDCASEERTELDTLLGKLDKGLSVAELTNLERLFGNCGSFYAERKAIMVSRLVREVGVYENSVEQLQTLKTLPINDKYKVQTWKELAQVEKKQAELFMELVIQQERIIKTLLEGKSADSEEIKAILTEVSETQSMLVVSTKEASEMQNVLSAP